MPSISAAEIAAILDAEILDIVEPSGQSAFVIAARYGAPVPEPVEGQAPPAATACRGQSVALCRLTGCQRARPSLTEAGVHFSPWRALARPARGWLPGCRRRRCSPNP